MLLQEVYKKEYAPALQQKLNIKNPMLIPKVLKVVVNSSSGEALQNQKIIDTIVEELSLITGQKPVKRKAKKSIAGFKLREGQIIGASVTLRGNMMYEFLNRLIRVALPRVRDFRGLSRKAFDGRGNYSLGIVEQIIFPEIAPEKVDKSRGFNITIVTNTDSNEQALELLETMGFPFKK